MPKDCIAVKLWISSSQNCCNVRGITLLESCQKPTVLAFADGNTPQGVESILELRLHTLCYAAAMQAQTGFLDIRT